MVKKNLYLKFQFFPSLYLSWKLIYSRREHGHTGYLITYPKCRYFENLCINFSGLCYWNHESFLWLDHFSSHWRCLDHNMESATLIFQTWNVLRILSFTFCFIYLYLIRDFAIWYNCNFFVSILYNYNQILEMINSLSENIYNLL